MMNGPYIIIILLVLGLVFNSGLSVQQLINNAAFGLPGILIGLAFHEFAHAFIADRLGDPLPRSEGRVTLDIRKHIDIIGLIFILIFQFGWAKPVQIEGRGLKNPRKDMALIALAGPIMNMIIALISVIIVEKANMPEKLQMIFVYAFYINAGLAAFNLIPVPPLDGSRVIGIFMPDKTYYKFVEFEYRYGTLLFIGLIMFGGTVFGIPIKIVQSSILYLGKLIAVLLPF